jgi:ATP-dependent HslUV protease ATP-binding subunit HslU
MILEGTLDDTEIEVDVPSADKSNPFSIDPSGSNPEAEKKWGEIFSLLGKRPSVEKKRMTLSEGRDIIYQMELDRLLEKVDLKKEAINAVQESGIVFIDEIDKICTNRDTSQWKSDASAEGVQRDLLPLVEGTAINTKHGNVNTDYILFIASGAFHSVKPSDMLPELQGRLPIRVELQALSENDLYKILTEPVANVSKIISFSLF